MSGEYIQETGCTIHERIYVDEHKTAWHRCTCHCGAEFVARGTMVRRGKRKSCGCMSAPSVRAQIRTKNQSTIRESLTHQLWAMRLWAGAK